MLLLAHVKLCCKDKDRYLGSKMFCRLTPAGLQISYEIKTFAGASNERSFVHPHVSAPWSIVNPYLAPLATQEEEQPYQAH
jgi:hypothetical protein